MRRSKVGKIIIGACIISAVLTVNVMIVKHEQVEASKREPFSSVHGAGNR